MNNSLKKNYLFLKWFFIIIVLETAILLWTINRELFLFKILVNYLFVAGLLPLIFEKIKKGKFDILSTLTVFTFFYLLIFGIRSIDLLIFSKHVLQNEKRYYITTIFYGILGLHFFQLAYFSQIHQAVLKPITKFRSDWSTKRLKIIIIIFSSISICSFYFIIKLSGGVSFYFGNIRDAMVAITSGSTIFFMGVLLIQIPLLTWFCMILERNKYSVFFFIYFILASILLISLGERGHFVFLLISMLICFHYLKRRIKTIQVFSLAMFIILFVVIYGRYRDFTEENQQIKKAGIKIDLNILTTYRYFIGHFDQLRLTKDVIRHVPEKLEFQYGKTFFNFLVKPIPSRIWQNKPQGAGRIITESLYPKANSFGVTVAPSLLAELYLNFHVIGIIIGMFIFGMVCKLLYELLMMNRSNKNIVVIYAICLPYIFSEIRGDFTIVTSFVMFQIFFLLTALYFLTPNNILKANRA